MYELLDSLHAKILKSVLAEEVTEEEIEALVKAKEFFRNTEMEEMKKAIADFIRDNWGTSEGEYVHRWRCNTFDDDLEGIKAIYNYVIEQ